MHDVAASWEDYPLPDYSKDLNALRRLLMQYPHAFQVSYYQILGRIVGVEESEECRLVFDYRRIGNATAPQQQEAFLRTLNLWGEGV